MISPETRNIVLRIAIIIASIEFIIMLSLSGILLEIGVYTEAVIDTTVLVLLSSPLIYYWVIKPFVTARDNALDKVNYLAHTDHLTNLPNRRLLSKHFEKFIAGSIRRQIYGAVLLLDLDGFKIINDEYGHDAGDAVLIEIANRISSVTRSEDVAARLGGDEFIILISQLDADVQIARAIVMGISEKLIKLVNQPIIFEGKSLHVGASIGICLLGLEKVDADTAIRGADIAMYNAKQAGKGRAEFCEVYKELVSKKRGEK